MAFTEPLMEKTPLPLAAEIFGYVAFYSMLNLAFPEKYGTLTASQKRFYSQCEQIQAQIQNAFSIGAPIVDIEELTKIEAQLLKHKRTSGLLYGDLRFSFNELCAFSWQSMDMPASHKRAWILLLMEVQEQLQMLFLKWYQAGQPPCFVMCPHHFYSTKPLGRAERLSALPIKLKAEPVIKCVKASGAFSLNNADLGMAPPSLKMQTANAEVVRLIHAPTPGKRAGCWSVLWARFKPVALTTPNERTALLPKR